MVVRCSRDGEDVFLHLTSTICRIRTRIIGSRKMFVHLRIRNGWIHNGFDACEGKVFEK